jgi:hypothetical protein
MDPAKKAWRREEKAWRREELAVPRCSAFFVVAKMMPVGLGTILPDQ